MTTTTTAPSLLDRLDAALAAVATLARQEAEVSDAETGGAHIAPDAWADLGDQGRAAAHTAGAVLEDVRGLLDAVAAFAAMGDASSDVADHLVCDEVDALALILARAGHVDEAAGWISDHATPGEGTEGDMDDDDRVRHHDVWVAYDAEDDYCEGREGADIVALGYVHRQLLAQPVPTAAPEPTPEPAPALTATVEPGQQMRGCSPLVATVEHETARVTVYEHLDEDGKAPRVLVIDVDSVDDEPAVRVYLNDGPLYREDGDLSHP